MDQTLLAFNCENFSVKLLHALVFTLRQVLVFRSVRIGQMSENKYVLSFLSTRVGGTVNFNDVRELKGIELLVYRYSA